MVAKAADRRPWIPGTDFWVLYDSAIALLLQTTIQRVTRSDVLGVRYGSRIVCVDDLQYDPCKPR